MTFLELQQLVSFWVDDLNFGYFTQPQVQRFLNNAQKELQKLLLNAGQNYYLKPCQTMTVMNQSDYVLPEDFEKLHRLELVISGTVPNETIMPMYSITLNQKDLITIIPAQPEAYFLKKDRIVLVPAPNVVLPLRLYYSPAVTDMTLDNDVPDAPEQYHEYIAVLAAYDCLLKDGRDPSTLDAKIKYYENMLKMDAQQRLVDSPRRVVDTGITYNNAGMIF